MYDAVNIVVRDFFPDPVSIFNESEITYHDPLRKKWKAQYKSLCLTQSKDAIRIHGSLPKFLHGHNIHPLNPSELHTVMAELSIRIGSAILNGNVTRLELASTIEVARNPDVYLAVLRSPSRLDRVQYDPKGKTVYFENGRKKITIYDKDREMRAKKMGYPPSMKGKHLLRFELTLKKDVVSQLKLPGKLKFAQLVQPDILLRVLEAWHREVQRVRISPSETIDTVSEEAYKSAKCLRNTLACIGMGGANGLKHHRDRIAALAKDGCITRQQKARANGILEELMGATIGEDSMHLNDELHEKLSAEFDRLRVLYASYQAPELPPQPPEAPRPKLRLVKQVHNPHTNCGGDVQGSSDRSLRASPIAQDHNEH